MILLRENTTVNNANVSLSAIHAFLLLISASVVVVVEYRP